MSRFENKSLDTFFKAWAKNLGLAENLVFHKKNMMVKNKAGSDKTIKVGGKVKDLGFFG